MKKVTVNYVSNGLEQEQLFTKFNHALIFVRFLELGQESNTKQTITITITKDKT